ncbi:MAG: protein-export rane protein SecD, preprotein translocase subunit SecD [Parcubacteria group bacterium]|nr:protein-export rane protein SecD, preprotein translocase subunit SecD [Parcubacteria group bacterium]
MRFLPALGVLVVAGLLGWFAITTQGAESKFPVKLGLDLAGGTELIYRADTSTITADKQGALNSLRDIIDRRVNLFGVAEPLVELERSSAVAGTVEDRLLVELPGVTDVKAAVDAIGKTPVLNFKLVRNVAKPTTVGTTTSLNIQKDYTETGLTGRYLKNAELQFSQGGTSGVANQPVIVLNFTEEGAALFEKITRENVGKELAIFLDEDVISSPVIQEEISGGAATITGSFTPNEGRELVRNLNFGALPVPIELVSSNTVGATLGADAFHAGLLASVIGFALVALFMIVWYRLPGIVATVALIIYVLITIAVIKFVPITLTASGIAGFILSIGMAVDANVLIFERMKEEIRQGKGGREAVRIGFARAWPAIRDGHLTMLISAAILFWIGTSLVQGFALVFGFGVIASLISAVAISRVFLLAIVPEETTGPWHFLLEAGFGRKKKSNS